jgi:hypothetical protein
MSVRAYMLLDIVDKNCEDAVEMLRSRTEVILVDHLEGYPNIIAMIEAADKKGLVEAVMPVLENLDGITENIQLVVTRDHELSLDLPASSNLKPSRKNIKKTNSSRNTTSSQRI